MMNKKAQDVPKSASSAAGLLALVGLFILLYLLFVPPDFRDQILNGDFENGTSDVSVGNAQYKLLLEERPGLLNYVDVSNCENNECDHELPSFSLYRSSSAKEIASFNPFIIKNTIFSKQFKTLNFEVKALPNTDNFVMSFGAKQHIGTLKIVLNGNTIFEGDVEDYNVGPIKIPKSMINDANVIEFSVSGVGAKFWQVNRYEIENFKIIGDVTDRSKEKNAQTFYISEEEFNAIDSSKLKFYPNCEESVVGALKVLVNGEKVFEGVPDCGMINVMTLSKRALEKGENTISFVSMAGNYIIDHINLRTYLKKLSYPTYYFDLTDEDWANLEENKTKLNVTLDFAKRPSDDFNILLHINGYTRTMRVENDVTAVERNIDVMLLKKKNNWITFEPEDEAVNIADMRLELKVVG